MAAQAQHVYRDLLRTVRKHAKGDHFSDFICQKFRDGVASKDLDALQKNVALAKDYAYLVKSVHAHKVWGVFLSHVFSVGSYLCIFFHSLW